LVAIITKTTALYSWWWSTTGVDVSIKKVNLTIEGVKAQLQLTARLENVVKIVNKTLNTLDRNPNLLNVCHCYCRFVCSPTLQGLVNSIAGLLSSVIDSTGNVVQRIIDWAGNIVLKTLNAETNDVSVCTKKQFICVCWCLLRR
jgi:hypothetical protein